MGPPWVGDHAHLTTALLSTTTTILVGDCCCCCCPVWRLEDKLLRASRSGESVLQVVLLALLLTVLRYHLLYEIDLEIAVPSNHDLKRIHTKRPTPDGSKLSDSGRTFLEKYIL